MTDAKNEIAIVLLEHVLGVITGLIYETVLFCIDILT